MTTKYPTPRGLAKSGRKMWRDIATVYELRPDEARILEDACKQADLVDELEAARLGAPYMVKGSQGQDVINPLISEVRQHRGTLQSLLGSLNLPDESGETPRSVSARRAAASRWSKTG